jgi:hypothetical protein
MQEHSSILNFPTTTTTARSIQDRLPQSLPFSGAMPAVPASSGGASGSSAPSFGGAGSELGVLTLLLIALLGGKFLWNARNILKPNSIFHLVINQPG